MPWRSHICKASWTRKSRANITERPEMKLIASNPALRQTRRSQYEARKRGMRFGSWVSELLREAHLDEQSALDAAADELLSQTQAEVQ